MTNHEAARGLWSQALEIRRSEAADAFAKESWNLCVRRCQEAVELSLKAALRFLGFDYPKRHDVSDLFVEAARQKSLPISSEDLGRIQRISKELAELRGLAFYMERGFSRQEAAGALQGAEEVLKALLAQFPSDWPQY